MFRSIAQNKIMMKYNIYMPSVTEDIILFEIQLAAMNHYVFTKTAIIHPYKPHFQ